MQPIRERHGKTPAGVNRKGNGKVNHAQQVNGKKSRGKRKGDGKKRVAVALYFGELVKKKKKSGRENFG